MLVIPDVTRYTVVGTYGGRDTANIIDMEIIDPTIGTRTEFIDDVAGRILKVWDQHILTDQNASYTALRVEWVDLHSEEGGTGQTVTGEDQTWPQPGGNALAGFPGNVAWLITKVCNHTRATRNGRMYVPGAVEAWTSTAEPNILTQVALDDLQPSAESFLTDINSGETGYDANMVVVHADPIPDPANPPAVQGGTYDRVESLQVQGTLATQRRRLRG